jgi:excinuclease ABC subunit C
VSEAGSAFDAAGFVASLPTRPGVYRMFAADGKVIYVGKAKNLKSRVASYFRGDQVAPKVMALVREIAAMEVTVTATEIEALILEHNLIKRHRPRFNVILRDDKTFPFVHLSTHEFPRLAFYRGNRRHPGRYFGPYPNARAVRDVLLQLQKLFRLRNCKDSFFANRARPCLQYQIRRCSGPCVGLVPAADYAADVRAAVMVLEGHSRELTDELTRRMDEAAQALEFEQAAVLRDRIAALKEVQARQHATSTRHDDLDVIGLASEGAQHSIAVMIVRGGTTLGTTHYFTRAPVDEPDAVLAQFIGQYYLEREPPPLVLVAHEVADAGLLEEGLAARAGRKVRIGRGERGTRARWCAMVDDNAANALRMRLASRAGVAEQLDDLRRFLRLEDLPARIECFDISHTQGESTVASCVVFGAEGPMKTDYRRYNIEGVAPGDDYAAMRQAVARRARRIASGESRAPDVLVIDGGPAQLAVAAEALAAEQVSIPVLLGISKGPDRRPGQERLFLLGQESPSILPPDSKALHLLQRVRDEAHRFAIAGHRRARAKARQTSVLEVVPGLGPARRRALLKEFGGLQGVLRAGIEDLERVKGISRGLAVSIFEHLHPGAG